jgi:hypothetical protein
VGRRRDPDLFYCSICGELIHRDVCPIHGDAVDPRKTAPAQKRPTSTTTTPSSTDHGALAGLSHDDHPQYHNDSRGDLRYLRTTAFVGLSHIYVGPTPPVAPSAGDLWVDTS